MKIIFCRHAEPDYEHDSITDKGKIEAELLARRLCRIDIDEIYVSPLGRARRTAEYTLEKPAKRQKPLNGCANLTARLKKTAKLKAVGISCRNIGRRRMNITAPINGSPLRS